MMQSQDYQKGYAAGRRKSESEFSPQKERIYLTCLQMVIEHCSNWEIAGKKINNAEGYCKLAKIFMDNSIKVLRDEK